MYELPSTYTCHVFHQALDALGRSELGAQRQEVIDVEAFWSVVGDGSKAAGFVLRLRNGRRVYLDVWIELESDDESGPLSIDIEIDELPSEQKYPRFPSASDPIGGWRYDVGPLNSLLRRLALLFNEARPQA